MNKSTDYHDFVFRDGVLVGEFEEMYQNSSTIPWHQDEQSDWIDVLLTKNMLHDIGRFDEIHDFGCGTGHYLDLMAHKFLLPSGMSYGYDISPSACDQAAKIFPNSIFRVLDLTTANRQPPTANRQDPAVNKLFMIRGTLWYVFPALKNVITNINSWMNSGDKLIVVQNFPPLSKQFIGKDVIPDHAALILHFSSHFILNRHIWYEDTYKCANDNWFIGLFTPRWLFDS